MTHSVQRYWSLAGDPNLLQIGCEITVVDGNQPGTKKITFPNTDNNLPPDIQGTEFDLKVITGDPETFSRHGRAAPLDPAIMITFGASGIIGFISYSRPGGDEGGGWGG